MAQEQNGWWGWIAQTVSDESSAFVSLMSILTRFPFQSEKVVNIYKEEINEFTDQIASDTKNAAAKVSETLILVCFLYSCLHFRQCKTSN